MDGHVETSACAGGRPAAGGGGLVASGGGSPGDADRPDQSADEDASAEDPGPEDHEQTEPDRIPIRRAKDHVQEEGRDAEPYQHGADDGDPLSGLSHSGI